MTDARRQSGRTLEPPGWVKRFPTLGDRPWTAEAKSAWDAVRNPVRLRMLCVIPSTNQMYSGVGRALRELAARMTRRVALEFAIDDCNPRNLDLLRTFAAKHKMPIHVGQHHLDPGYVDPINQDLPALLQQGRWDAIELIGFANAATGRTVLDQIGDTTLCYTPHDQPLWTVPMAPEQHANVATVHQKVLERADLVLADSPQECRQLQSRIPDRLSCVFLPLGCDFDAFPAGQVSRKNQLVFVGDLNEVRKRFDRVIALFARLRDRWPALRLIVIGNRSDEAGASIPESLRPAVDLRGYVSEVELRRVYAESRALILLSEVEAFGLPILEALVCGTPVFLSRLDTTFSLFHSFTGACFCPADDLEATLAVAERTLARGDHAHVETLADRPQLRERFDWSILAARKWQAIASAWYRKHCWSWSA